MQNDQNQTGQMYELLFRAVQEGTVDAVRKAASRIFGSAVSVTDNSFRVISADADPGSTDDMLEKNGDQVYVSEELLDVLKEHDMISNLTNKPHETILVDWGYFSEHPHITTGIFHENHILGSITALVDSCECTDEQNRKLQACADALALVLHDHESGKKKLSAERDRFISKLFHGSATPKDLANAGKNHFFSKSDRYVVIATDFIPDSSMEETEEESGMIVYLDTETAYIMADAQSPELADLEKWIENRGHRYGISYTFSDPLFAERAARQADAVLNFGSRAVEKKAAWSFGEHALDIMVSETQDASDFVHPGLAEMEQYDAENNTQYLDTLKEWLMHGMDYSATATAMNLHRNSLYYRMQRIHELFGIELDDMNTDVQLYLSICTK